MRKSLERVCNIDDLRQLARSRQCSIALSLLRTELERAIALTVSAASTSCTGNDWFSAPDNSCIQQITNPVRELLLRQVIMLKKRDILDITSEQLTTKDLKR